MNRSDWVLMVLAFLAIAAIAIFVSASVRAEVPCAARAEMEKKLAGPPYSEMPLFDATTPNPEGNGMPDVAVRLFANPYTGTWTLMISPNDKVGCMVMAGKEFKPSPMPKAGQPL